MLLTLTKYKTKTKTNFSILDGTWRCSTESMELRNFSTPFGPVARNLRMSSLYTNSKQKKDKTPKTKNKNTIKIN